MLKGKIKYVIGIAIILIIIIVAVVKTRDNIEYETIEAKIGDISQEISVIGNVKPAEAIELGFERSGKISYLPINVNDKVKKGQMLAGLYNIDLIAQLNQAQAGLSSGKSTQKQYEAALNAQQAKLDEYKKGTRTEEIQLAETTVANAEKTSLDANTNLQNVKDKAIADLDEDYNSALNALTSTVFVAQNTLNVITDLQFSRFNTQSQDGMKFSEEKTKMVLAILGANNSGFYNKETLYSLTGGIKGLVAETQLSPTQTKIDQTISAAINALQITKNALQAIPIVTTMTATDITTLYSEQTNINAEISTINSKTQTISVQKAFNQNAIATAEAAINTAKNNLNITKDQLKIKQAGYSSDQINAQVATVNQAQANVDSQKAQVQSNEANVLFYQAQVGKTIIRSPIDGIITSVNLDLGELASANSTIIKVASEAKFQIEANVAEVDIAQIEINDSAKATLDAYNEQEFSASVIKIDPAEILIDNVPTYKVTFEFTDKNNSIKPGMTANLDIVVGKKTDTVIIPQRAVTKKDGKKIVKILNAKNIISEIEVATGLRSTNGNVEILSGVRAGNLVVLSIKK